ncbi:glycosyltransferase family 4 protein [Calothrix sp. 336/3]|uniref:glycosyltransferase family 4 protein n=1 Tax=Calothrix sp. 336/3 TaxID=1337936 RepID=UPI0004E4143E|nr:glycosyltransferase family 4 protein [Calothrix sp. 336/3]AKG21115.1 glycosyl transferase family 1 [Calothrix sp. 336/3]
MRVLFLHNNFPAQYRNLALALAKNPKNQVVFGTKNKETNLPGIKKVFYEAARNPHPTTHHYVQPLESAVLHGQAVYKMLEQLKSQGFIPDIVCGHSGWGPTLFVKDALPQTPVLTYFEWFYNSQGADVGFDPKEAVTADDAARIRVSNASILTDLYSCDRGLSPTQWQKSQFPKEFHDKISVIHDGVDTEYFQPQPGAKLVLPELDLSGVEEIVTYVGRGMEPYRGFPQFIESIAYIQERRPNCHVVIVGSDRICYGKSLPKGQTYKELMLAKVPLDMSRVHFTGSLPYKQYLQVIQASSVHIYLTVPFVLSWSMIEAMSTGCLVLGSNTAPVTEVIEDGKNGLLVDFFSPQEIANRVDEVFNHPEIMKEIRANARQTVLEKYALANLLPKHIELLTETINRFK